MCCRLSEHCLSLWVKWDSPRIRSSQQCRRGISPLQMLQSGEWSSVMENYWYLVWWNECPWINDSSTVSNVMFPSAAMDVMGSLPHTHFASILVALVFVPFNCYRTTRVCWWKSLASELHLTFNNLHFVNQTPSVWITGSCRDRMCDTNWWSGRPSQLNQRSLPSTLPRTREAPDHMEGQLTAEVWRTTHLTSHIGRGVLSWVQAGKAR